VLAIRGKALETALVGEDTNGLVVEWKYPDVIYTMVLREQNGIEAYRVGDIKQR
jgi:hypothetical protein